MSGSPSIVSFKDIVIKQSLTLILPGIHNLPASHKSLDWLLVLLGVFIMSRLQAELGTTHDRVLYTAILV